MIILNAIIPIAIVVVIGIVLVKWNFVSEQFFSELSKVVFKVFVPIFLFTSVYKSGVQNVGWTIIGYFVPVLTLFVVIALLFSHRIALTANFSNGVLVGIPVIVAIAGEQGLTISLAVISVHSLILFTAFYLFSSKVNVTPSRFKTALNIFANPVIIGLLLGLFFKYSGIQIPSQLLSPLEMIAAATLPLALIILGSSLAQTSGFDKTLFRKTILIVTCKLVLLPGIVYVFTAKLLSLSDIQVLTLVILASCPTGISVMPFVEPVEKDKLIAHNAIALSTLFSIITIPTIIWLVQKLS